jgi:DNA mismatch endonuclease (patch repair protein)
LPSSAAATRIGRGNRRRDTKPEVALRSELHRRGLRFRKDLPIDLGEGRRSVRADIVLTAARIAVFVDGCFWHGCPDHHRSPRRNPEYWGPKIASNIARDRRVDDALALEGWTVVRVWEHEDVGVAAERIVAVWRSLRKGGR